MSEKIEVLNTANDYLYNLIGGINKLVEKIQVGKENEGVLLIPDIADGLAWVLNVITLTKDVHKREINNEEIDEKLNEVVQALENEDYILVGDLFNYEILPVVENVHNIIKSVVLN